LTVSIAERTLGEKSFCGSLATVYYIPVIDEKAREKGPALAFRVL